MNTPSGTEVEGASMPQGIAVDEAAAYFGVTDSADIIMHLNQTDQITGMGEFFSIAIDLVLQPEFGFEEAAQRLGCEGGEIYYLLTGPFGLVSLSDPLRVYLGGEDSEGNVGVHPGFPENEMNALESLTDIFSLLKMFGLGHLIGGLPLLSHYVSKYAELVAASDMNKIALLQLSQELHVVIEQTKSGSVSPISCLGAPTHASQPAPAPSTAPAPAPVQSPAPSPAPVSAPSPTPVQSPAPSPTPVQSPAPAPGPAPASVQSPAPAPAPVSAPAPAPSPAPVQSPAPAPASAPAPAVAPVASPAITSPQPVNVVPKEPAEQPPVESTMIEQAPPATTESIQPTPEQQVATSDAFASQFSAAADIDASVTPVAAEPVSEAPPTVSQSPPIGQKPQPFVEPQVEAPAPKETVQQTPQAVAPKRAPIVASAPPTPTTGWPTQEPPQMPETGWPAGASSPPEKSALDSVSDLVSGGPHAPQAPVQSVHHNIQSGKNCSRCGIGVEQSWQYCPICNCNL